MKRILIALFGALIFGGCSSILFDQPMPAGATVINGLPSFLQGTFYLEDGEEDPFYDFRSVVREGTTLRVTSFFGFPLDSLQKVLDSSEDDLKVVQTDTSINVSVSFDEGSRQTFIMRQKGNWYFSGSEDKYELDLDKELFTVWWEEPETYKAELRLHQGTYYLNYTEEDKWMVISFTGTRKDIIFTQNTIESDSIFETVLDVMSLEDNIINSEEDNPVFHVSDQEFSAITKYPGLLRREHWIRIDLEPGDENRLFWFGLIALFLLTGFILISRTRFR